MSTSPIFEPPLPWLEPGDPFPSVETAWSADSPAPGLLAAGGDLSVTSLQEAYSLGIFPWYGAGQPVLWWSTDPRMVLHTGDFRFHRSLRKTMAKLLAQGRLEVRIDHDFPRVIRTCAAVPRQGQSGTWILPVMVQAYERLHAAGLAHSVETWLDGEMAGGLYCVNLGAAVFGESMFSRQTDASKMALAALVAFCRANGLPMIDCQQDTAHLAHMGARPISRAAFTAQLRQAIRYRPPAWNFQPVYWNTLFHEPRADA